MLQISVNLKSVSGGEYEDSSKGHVAVAWRGKRGPDERHESGMRELTEGRVLKYDGEELQQLGDKMPRVNGDGGEGGRKSERYLGRGDGGGERYTEESLGSVVQKERLIRSGGRQ